MQKAVACPRPLLLRGPCQCAPPLAPPPLPPAGFAPPRLCAQTVNEGQRVKVRPTLPFAPRPAQSNRTARARDPRTASPSIPPPFIHERGHRLRPNTAQKRGRVAPPPPSCVPPTHTRERSTRTGGRDGPPFSAPPSLPRSR
jgi:hypothetical protein